jgi:hypothetical protein
MDTATVRLTRAGGITGPVTLPSAPALVQRVLREHRRLGLEPCRNGRNDVTRALWPLLAILIACSACRSDAPAAPSASRLPSVSAAAPSPHPTAVVLTKAQAATRYLRIVRPYNAALQRFQTAAHAGQSWIRLRTLAGRISTANAAQIKALHATRWPADARARVTTLISVSTRAGRYWHAAATATAPDRFRTAVLQAARLSGKPEATALRRALGLPPYRRP